LKIFQKLILRPVKQGAEEIKNKNIFRFYFDYKIILLQFFLVFNKVNGFFCNARVHMPMGVAG
jgi:hypothetical protein